MHLAMFVIFELCWIRQPSDYVSVVSFRRHFASFRKFTFQICDVCFINANNLTL